MVSTTPNEVAQNRNTTLAAETMPGTSAGSVTVRNTCHGLAPSTAAASSRRGSIASQKAPTVRTTTLMLKKTSAATIAAAVPSSPSEPSGPDGAISWRKATPTTTVGSTNGTTTSARSRSRPGKRSRCSTNATGSPAATDTRVATPADQTVNQSTRCVRGRPSTSTTPLRSKDPSGQSPRASMPATG